jgi:hypothetical protein
MKLRLLGIAIAAAAIGLAGCGDDITNFIEELPPDTPSTPPTQPPPTNTPPATQPPPPTSTPGTPEPTNTPGAAICGNAEIESPEECDVGGICDGGANDLAACDSATECPDGFCRVVGGAEIPGGGTCAANCTIETDNNRITSRYAQGSGSSVQLSVFRIDISLTGSQTVQAGEMRDDPVEDVNGMITFEPGDIPIRTAADDIRIDPVVVSGLVCACVRGIEVPNFGPGNAGTGVVACGESTSRQFDYVLAQDHNTDPAGPARDPECALPLDPECDDANELPGGVLSEACLEGEDEDCMEPQNQHHPPALPAAVCNSPRSNTFSGQGTRGSAIISNQTAIGLLQDGGRCCGTSSASMACPSVWPPPDVACPFADYGPDCLPCTDDDADFGVPENNPTTTGTAKGVIYNANNVLGLTVQEGSGLPCQTDADCNPDVCGGPEICYDEIGEDMMPTGVKFCGVPCTGSACVTQKTGSLLDCDGLLSNNPSSGLRGAALAVTFPAIDSASIGDNVTSTVFVFE